MGGGVTVKGVDLLSAEKKENKKKHKKAEQGKKRRGSVTDEGDMQGLFKI